MLRLLAIGCALSAPLYAAAQPATAPISGSTKGQVQSPGAPPSLERSPPTRADRLAALRRIRNWGYQLKRLSRASIAASPFDLMVIDYAPDRIHGREIPFTPAELATMKRRPDGGRRLMFAYLSIGEAERYRAYWQSSWYVSPPRWLGPMNPQWPGNYPVRFWDNDWRSIIYGSADAYLDRILAAGFDGVYIDRADIADYWAKSRPTAPAEMARLVATLSDYARRKRPEFLVIMQNAEELLSKPRVRDAIDGLAKEDLFYGIDHAASANAAGDVNATVSMLAPLKRRGKTVLVVEYLDTGSAKAADAVRRARRLGYVPLIAERALDTMPPAR